MVDPASSDNSSAHTVKTDDVVSGEEGVEDETNNATDGVFSEHIEGIVNSEVELDLGAKITADASNNAEDNRRPRGDKSGGRGSCDKTGNGTGTPADQRPLLGQTEIENAPSHGRDHGCQARVPARHDRPEVSTECRPSVEAEPAEPEEDGAECNQGDVVWAKVEHHLLVSPTKNPGVGEGGHSGNDLDRATAGIIENSIFKGPSVDVPYPAGNRAVDQSRPDEGKDHGGNDAATLGSGSDDESGGDGAELELVKGIEELGDQWRARRWLSECVHETEVM